MLNLSRPIHDAPVFMPSAASTLYEPGDLLWNDSGVAKPASAMPDQGTEGDNQTYFAARFLGICGSQKLAANTGTNDVQIIFREEYQFNCASSTFVVGDYVAGDEDVSGTALEDQQVKKTSTAADAVAIVMKAESSASTKVFAVPLSILNRTAIPA